MKKPILSALFGLYLLPTPATAQILLPEPITNNAVVPDSLGRLAASASTIRNRIFITGGYAVLAGGKELSSPHLFIFDPQTETYTQGASLPHAIDDHVQAVWRDSLLYVVSGWSDSLTVARVQVYVPSENRSEPV